ncbi:MAG: DNA polymerase III subunit delta [Minisyncoccia bacterium]|jgi:DNA polymerase-3 subunit delta
MIIFLYGKDGYRLKQNLEKIIAEYKKKHENGLAFYVFDFDLSPHSKFECGGVEDTRNEIEKFDNVLKTVGFFDEKKLIVIKDAFGVADKIAGLVKKWDLAGDKEKIVVFVENGTEAELNKRSKKLFSLLETKPNIVKEFAPLTGKRLEDWIVKEAELIDARIEPAAARKLVEYAGNDSWRLSVELEKLANYKMSLPPHSCMSVGEADVKLLVTPIINLNIFETIDAIGQRNRGKAMVLLSRHLSEGEDPYYLFSMVVYQFRNLLRVKSLAPTPMNGCGGKAGTETVLSVEFVAKKTGMNPFVVRKTLEQSRKYELEELKQKFTRLADYDIAIKNGSLDIVDCLYQIALG